jgi:unsaturated rhamnogalacturonyl hydrolase
VSFGTPVFDTLQGYRDIPLTSMPYGQSMAILALGEFRLRFI